VRVPTVATDPVSLGLIAVYLKAEALVADLGLQAGSDHVGAAESAERALRESLIAHRMWPLSPAGSAGEQQRKKRWMVIQPRKRLQSNLPLPHSPKISWQRLRQNRDSCDEDERSVVSRQEGTRSGQ
jgi:hypothetical protein